MKVLMVCLGNICRSPLAHGVLAELSEKAGLDWEIDSAGTGNWHVGQQPDRRSIAVARKYGVDISKQCCRQFTEADFDYYDHIFVMDQNNMRDVNKLARNENDKRKVRLLLSNEIVPDPYYDDDQFEPVFLMVEKRCRQLIDELKLNT